MTLRLPGELVTGDRSAERQSDDASHRHRREAHLETQQHDSHEVRIGGQHEPDGLTSGRGNVVHGVAAGLRGPS